jgi:hypothetical protein
MGKSFRPEQGGAHHLPKGTIIDDANGSCQIVVVQLGDGSFVYGHFDNPREFQEFVDQHQKNGRPVARIGNFSNIDGIPVEELFEREHKLTERPKKWG